MKQWSRRRRENERTTTEEAHTGCERKRKKTQTCPMVNHPEKKKERKRTRRKYVRVYVSINERPSIFWFDIRWQEREREGGIRADLSGVNQKKRKNRLWNLSFDWGCVCVCLFMECNNDCTMMEHIWLYELYWFCSEDNNHEWIPMVWLDWHEKVQKVVEDSSHFDIHCLLW